MVDIARNPSRDRHTDELRNPGLGLYLVRQFVELHAGSVAVETTAPDGGMRYTVTLPTTGCEGALLVAPASLGAST